jgi:HEAT repeat protein
MLPINSMKAFLIVALLIATTAAQQRTPSANEQAANLVNQFKAETAFWKQFEIGKRIVALHNRAVLTDLSDWLSHDDRHIRGNVAFIFASLGDERGFHVITDILADRSYRPEGQGQAVASSDGRYHVEQQIRADRYYAAHLLGDLKDPRAVPVLIPLLHDSDVNYIVPWSLGEIGDHGADEALILTLSDPDPSLRVLAIFAIQKLSTRTALPRLHELESDQARSNFGDMITVAEAAKAAIMKLEAKN